MNQRSTIIALILLILGMSIYATCRQDVIFLTPFKETAFFKMIKIHIHYDRNIFVYFFLFCLPDILWYIALLLFQEKFYNNSNVSKIIFWIAVSLPFILELLQNFTVIYGTFDFVDLAFYLLTFLSFLLCTRKKQI